MQRQLDELAFRLLVGPGVAPAAAVAVLFRQDDSWVCARGSAGVRSRERPRPITAESPFDLASVTKPVVAAGLARLAEAGRLDLQAPLGALLGEQRAGRTSTCSLELLLSHRAGLSAHLGLYAPLIEQRAFERDQALSVAANARRSECSGRPPTSGFPPVYSDLGYILAGDAAESLLGRCLDELVFDEVCAPLGLTLGSARQWLRRSPSFLDQVVPTEQVPWRGGELAGAVHDDNAWALTGHGLSGHAGLFGSVEQVVRFGGAMLDALAGRNTAWLAQKSARWLVRDRPGGTLRAGFDGKAQAGSSAGKRSGPRTFGHLGFTGTSLWCDPDAEVAVALLSNRVNIQQEREAPTIRDVRPEVHDLLFGLAERWKTAPRD